MKVPKILFAVVPVVVTVGLGVWLLTRTTPPSSRTNAAAASQSPGGFIGTSSCRECHEPFYQKWATSYHGSAMRPFSAEWAGTQLTSEGSDFQVGGFRYRAVFENGEAFVREKGPDGEKRYRIEYALGGKNVYYFLTPLERGRLQVLPVAYDVREKTWYDTTASMVRHASLLKDESLGWKDRLLSFNTSCYNCHVSQLSSQYDLETDSYRIAWAEPGINCETCHGGSREHVRLFRETPKDRTPKDPKIIRMKAFTTDQVNAACASCHAKMTPLAAGFRPGDRFFDFFKPAAFENPDFYPDGRDLGENYTYTSWLTSPCVKSGRLDCLHCHTSSGRYKFKDKSPNDACLPCHAEHVAGAAAHSHHPAEAESSRCISCHMPKTQFARMVRSDHSMRPPTPAVTMAYESPNACNICHADKDAAWSDRYVREWRLRDYQAPVLHRAGLISAARRAEWTRLDEMLAYLNSKDRDDMFAVSLIRLLRFCDDKRKWPVITAMLNDPSPLVRAGAAESLSGRLAPRTVEALLQAAADEYRLVRVGAAAALSAYPRDTMDPRARLNMDRATAEYEESLRVRPDDYRSFFNLGNYYMDRKDIPRAVASFVKAMKLEPNSVRLLVNASIAFAKGGKNDQAEESLRRALQIDPQDPVANLDLGLLLGGQGRKQEAERVLRAALNSDPNLAAAAYNLGILLARDRLAETLVLCRRAYRLAPEEPQYAYTLAFFLNQSGDRGSAVTVLEGIIERQRATAPCYLLLGEILENQGKTQAALNVYQKAAADDLLNQEERAVFAARAGRKPPRT
jgi:tetratricopeptide (TPR) repeat protein